MTSTEAFRLAAEPCFDTSHVDGSMNIQAVFPGCMDEPVFLNALAYSMVQILDRGRITVESLNLKGKTVQLLNEKLASTLQCPDTLVIGAIMILKSVAYKYEDYAAHELHSHGLTMSLRACRTNKTALTAAAARAVFWLDLFGNLLISSPRQLSHLSLPSQICWRRTISQNLDTRLALPPGFARHYDLLPHDLLDCILDTLELQRSLLTCPQKHEEKYPQLDSMQASIESRLAIQRRACREFGRVAEAVRLAMFITCYQMWTETWESALLPSKIAAQLVDILEVGLCGSTSRHTSQASTPAAAGDEDSVWNTRRDLQLWLLFVGACAAELDRGHVDGLRARYAHVLRRFHDLVIDDLISYRLSSSSLEYFFDNIGETDVDSGPKYWKKVFHAALDDFVYCDRWREPRLCVPEWFELETTVYGDGECWARYADTASYEAMTAARLNEINEDNGITDTNEASLENYTTEAISFGISIFTPPGTFGEGNFDVGPIELDVNSHSMPLPIRHTSVSSHGSIPCGEAMSEMLYDTGCF
jgi:hypothetical protein